MHASLDLRDVISSSALCASSLLAAAEAAPCVCTYCDVQTIHRHTSRHREHLSNREALSWRAHRCAIHQRERIKWRFVRMMNSTQHLMIALGSPHLRGRWMACDCFDCILYVCCGDKKYLCYCYCSQVSEFSLVARTIMIRGMIMHKLEVIVSPRSDGIFYISVAMTLSL